MRQSNTGSFGHHYYSKRLQRKMNMLSTSKAAIVEAPTGYGKTTAMRDFIKILSSPEDKIYWFSGVVEEAPTVLYRRLCREIRKIDKNAGERLIEIDFPNAFTIEEVCDTLRSVRCSQKTWLVIDDFQFLFVMLPPSFLSTLLDINDDKLRVVIITQLLGQEIRKSVIHLGIPYINVSDLRWNADDIRSYFDLVGESISETEAGEVEKITEGWVIAVYLQHCSYIETRTFSDNAVSLLMENLIWNKMTYEQQNFLMRISVFESCTLKRLCRILECDTLPDYVKNSLSIPFIRYISESKLYVPHILMREMVRMKRREQGEKFENECLLKAGDVCRDEGEYTEAVYYYAQIKNYRRILSLNLSGLVCNEIGDGIFNDIALDIAKNCSIEIKKEYLHSMLCVAWSVRFLDNKTEFMKLMSELDDLLPEDGLLRAEWLLLSVYIFYPNLEGMFNAVKKAADKFNESCSTVILPEVPWAFYEYIQLSTFHLKVGAADEEADLFEKFISIYSRLTGGHGSGADTLFRAELAFYRCETEQAEILAYKAVFLSECLKQKIIQIGAVRLLAVIALLKSDLTGWQRVVDDVDRVVFGSVQNTLIYRLMLDVIHSSFMAQLREYDRVADWLKTSEFQSLDLPAAIYAKAVEMHGYYLMGKGEYAQLIGFLQSIPLEKFNPFPVHFYFFTIAVGYLSSGDKTRAAEYIKSSADKILPDDFLHCFVGFSRLLDGLPDELIKKSYPDSFTRFNEYKERYFTGWSVLYTAIAQNELQNILTEREREIAELAAEGLRNIEIANMLFLSEHTVRAHLRSIYQKLDIDRRAKLVNLLK